MDRLFKSILSIREIKLRTDDDYVDRLSHQFTVIMLVCFSFLVSTKQFVGKPISCWCPAHFTDSHKDYANTICWVSNTYYLPMDETIPKDRFVLEKHNKMISYYQWVPLILMFQAFLAFVPRLFWRFLNKRSGINLATIMDAAHVCAQASYLEIREKAIRYVVNQMDRYLLAQRDYRTGCCIRAKHMVARMCCLVGGRLYGNYLTSAYLVVKVIYVTNAIGQLFMLDAFLGMEYHLYGAYVVEGLVRGRDWAASERFPRVTLCDFEIRHQSRLHSYVVQCVLTINLFNEKIFIFIWFWYVFLSIVSTVNLCKWLVRSLYWRGQVRYVRKQLRAFDTAQREPGVLAKFTESYLRRDGMFILRLIGMNMGEVIAGETLCGLWNSYSPERRQIAEKPGRKQAGKVSRQNGGQRMEVV
ncbi:Innexin unc-7 [Lamellibrachia satsuma]|nr:Innexin unc-7 [Lamellibrachia satsuma]